MKYYTLARNFVGKATCISIVNNDFELLQSGHLLAETVEEPVECEFDEGLDDGDMATFYPDRGVIATQAFYDDLIALGVDNIETRKAVIRTEDGSREYNNYLLLNFLGRVSCADLDSSDVQTIDEDMHVIDSLAMKADSVKDRMLFLVDEDTYCIVVNEVIYKALSEKYEDLLFEEVSIV